MVSIGWQVVALATGAGDTVAGASGGKHRRRSTVSPSRSSLTSAAVAGPIDVVRRFSELSCVGATELVGAPLWHTLPVTTT